jgi:hypothetical protein
VSVIHDELWNVAQDGEPGRPRGKIPAFDSVEEVVEDKQHHHQAKHYRTGCKYNFFEAYLVFITKKLAKEKYVVTKKLGIGYSYCSWGRFGNFRQNITPRKTE